MQTKIQKRKIEKIIHFLLIVHLLFGIQNAYSQGRIFAVVVGVSEYENPINNLKYCHKDAEEFYNLLKPHTTTDRMKLLTDVGARHSNIVFYAQQLFRQAKPEDIVIFYFSGHGNNNRFITHDKSLYFKTLQKIFRECNADRKMIFADACYAGTLRQEGNSSGRQNVGKNVMLFMSSRSNQMSIEYLNLQNGLFTYYLISGLKGEADANRDNYITAFELFNYVNPKVKQSTNEKQVPVMWGNFDKNMVILKTEN